MSEKSGIEWTDATWNPWYGCRKVSPACAHCYAERDMKLYKRDFNTVTRAKDATFYAPLKWITPRKIFTCSWSDFFIEEADRWRGEAFNVISDTQRHTYLILTKRPERIAEQGILVAPNIWVGVSVENQHFAETRIPILLEVPAAIHWLSCEPLLGPVRLPEGEIDWVIVGGESGPKAKSRPTELQWMRGLRDQCAKRKIAFFVKQITDHGIKMPFDSWPEDLRVREFPA